MLSMTRYCWHLKEQPKETQSLTKSLRKDDCSRSIISFSVFNDYLVDVYLKLRHGEKIVPHILLSNLSSNALSARHA